MRRIFRGRCSVLTWLALRGLIVLCMATPLDRRCISLFVYYYPGQKNRYSREIHEVDLQFDHVISCDIELRFDIEWHAAAAARRELALHLQIEVDVT